MRFIEFGKLGLRSVGAYFGGISLLVFLYFLGTGAFVLALKLQFSDLPFTLEDPSFYNIFGRNRFLAWMLLPFLLMAVGLCLYVWKVHGRKIRSLFTAAPSFRWSRFWFMVALSSGVFAIEFGVSYFSGQLVWNFNATAFLRLSVVALLGIPVQATCEELIFRSYALQGLFARTAKLGFSMALSALLFAAMHVSNPEVNQLGYSILGYYWMAGFFLALITVQSDGIELSMGFHSINNLLAALLITSEWQAFKTDALWTDLSTPSSPWPTIVGGLLIFTLMYVVLKKKFGWKWWPSA
ncbi:MAG: hypothetical protein RLZZ301_719 [Bacteroidota bacterium]|jgi:membrane protease YdiL (CAAX protease family)